MGLEPKAAGWKAQTTPLSYGDTLFLTFNLFLTFFKHCLTEAKIVPVQEPVGQLVKAIERDSGKQIEILEHKLTCYKTIEIA